MDETEHCGKGNWRVRGEEKHPDDGAVEQGRQYTETNEAAEEDRRSTDGLESVPPAFDRARPGPVVPPGR